MKKEMANIFSKTETKKEIANKLIPIIIDTREKQSLVASFLKEKNAQIKFETLEIGDYLIADTIVERKTFSDFQASIIDKRLIEQLKNLQSYEKRLLILEKFNFDYASSRIHENALRGMLLAVSMNFNTPIVYSENEQDTAKFLISIAKRYENEKKELSIRPEKKERSLQETKQFILEGFPGIGPTTAKKLLNENKTLKNIFNLKEKSLIKNLDENKAKEFIKILNN